MYDGILRQMRDKIRLRQYLMTLHAEEEMSDDGFTIFDVERAILTGDIVERQRDNQSNEWKYLVAGRSFQNEPLTVVAKVGPTPKLVIITVFRTE
mgnify:CR=1 FL=1